MIMFIILTDFLRQIFSIFSTKKILIDLQCQSIFNDNENEC